MTKKEAREYGCRGYKFIFFENHKRHGKLAAYQRQEENNLFTVVKVPVISLPARELEKCIALGVSYE